MRINLSTPLSDDKEMQRRNNAVLGAIEQYTEERMNDEYGRIHTDGSRSGGQPTQGYGVVTAANYTSPIGGAGVVTHGVVGVATQSDALREALEDLLHAVCGEKGFAEAVRRDSGRIYPWPALDLAEAKALEALEQSK
jgi:hypothetical protein